MSADASSYGLGAVLLQEHPDGLRPVAFASRTLTKSERKYAQIEKECLASTWACEKFDRYLVGLKTFSVVTDHKPLVPLINTKDLSETPLRCQRMLMRLMRFNVKANYVPGKDMLVADTLSRSPVSTTESSSHEEVQAHVSDVQSSWQVSDAGLAKIRAETLKDVNLKAAMEYTIHGWPQYKEVVQLAARDFFIIRGELSLHDGRQNSRSFQLEKTNSGRDPRGPHGRGKVQGTCCTINVVATDWKTHKITGRQLPTLSGEAAIPGQWTPPTISTPRQTLSEGRHWHLWVPKQALPGAGGLLLKVYWRHIPAQLDISNGDREIKEHFLPPWRSRDSCFRQRYPVLLGRVPYFCRSVELQPYHQQSPLSSKQWCCGASGEDRQRDPQAGRHLPCPFVLPLNPHSRPRS